VKYDLHVRSRRSRRVDRHRSNPWFIERRRPIIDRVSDLRGRTRVVSTCRIGDTIAICEIVPWDESADDPREGVDPEQTRRWIRLKISETIQRYRDSGQFTDRQLLTIIRLWVDGWTLRQLARYQEVAPAAISSRIEALRRKAPEFYTWWSFKHRRRRY